MKYLLTLFVIPFILACNQNKTNTDQIIAIDTVKIKVDSSNAVVKIFGDRLKLSGDFDGDGISDTIYESFISLLTGKETYKIMDSVDWDNNVDLVYKSKPISRIYSNIKNVDTFIVANRAQQSGIALLENLGNINNVKGDEIGLVINWDDYSNLNGYKILTLDNNKWKEIFYFEINEQVSFEPENLFEGKNIIVKDGKGKIKYKAYEGAEIKTGEHRF